MIANPEGPDTMRLFAFMLAALAATPAAAQSWKEYSYPDYAIAVSFPAAPAVETVSYPIADGATAPAQVYSVAQDNGVFKMTVVDLDAAAQESVVMDHAVATLSQNAEVKVNIPARVGRVYGRQLSLAGADGSRSSVALFVHNQRLYQIEGKALPGGDDATAEAIRFQQSLIFTDGGYGYGGRGRDAAAPERGPRDRPGRGDRNPDRPGRRGPPPALQQGDRL
jgi:hypothetical protein